MNDGVGLGLEKEREYSRDDGMAEVQMQGMTWHEKMDLAATGESGWRIMHNKVGREKYD